MVIEMKKDKASEIESGISYGPISARKCIMEMETYDPPLEGRKGKLRLDFNENTKGPSKKVMDAIASLSKEDISAYPEYGSFLKKLSGSMGIKTSQMILTNASDDGIRVVFDTYIDDGSQIVLPVPTFPMFEVYAKIRNAEVRKVLYQKDLSFPAKGVLASISKKTRIVVLVNPNNPTGTPIRMHDIIKIADKAMSARSIVLIDEAYVQYSNDSALGLLAKYNNLILLQTFSKAFGLAGLRLGIIISDEKNIEQVRKANSPYSVNVASVAAASAALDDPGYVKHFEDEVKDSKKLLEETLDSLGIRYYPSAANFLLVRFGAKSKSIQRSLNSKGILVRDRSSLPMLDGTLRIGIGTVQQMKRLIRELKKVL